MPRIQFQNISRQPLDLHESIVVGRSEGHANIVIKDDRLSRAHCRFEPREDDWAVVDLDSQNGTFVNGRRVDDAVLRNGDIVTIGAVDLRYQTSGMSGEFLGAPDSTATVVAPAALVLLQGSLSEELHPITHDPFTIGRKADNHLCLEGDGKSTGYHARIKRDGAGYVLEDLGSTNGTMVNGTRITAPVVLKSGMKVVIGSQLFRFQLHGRPDQSSGETSPGLAAEPATRKAPEKEPQDEHGALQHKVRFKGRGGALFAAVEILVVIVVAAAALFAAWTMTSGGQESATREGGSFPQAREGGLLTSNPSFDERDEGGFPAGWRYLVSGTDSFALAEGARGGRYGLQLGRYRAGNETSLALSPVIEFNKGIHVSAYALNPEHGSGRLGVAVVQVYWYSHPRDRTPILVSPVGARTGMREWTEIAGSVAAPPGARAFSVAVGISGTPGSVMFDDISVSADENAGKWIEPQQAGAGGLVWNLRGDGAIELSGPEGPLIRDGRVLLFPTEGRADGLDPLDFLVADPVVTRSGNDVQLVLRFLDPLGGSEMTLQVELSAKDGASLAARLDRGQAADRSSRYVAFSGLATALWLPAQVVRFEGDSGTPSEFSDTIGAGRNSFSRLLSADTGTGHVIESTSGAANAWITPAPGGRELLLARAQALELRFIPGSGHDELLQEVALVAAVQAGEDHVDRVQRALRMMLEYPYNQAEAGAAAEAVDAVAKHFRVRLIELRDAINVPQLTRNEQLYRSAMREAIQTAERLHGASESWEEARQALATTLGGAGMNRRSQDVAAKARAALAQLGRVAHEFDELSERARRSLFLLEIEIEQRESTSHMASARDFQGGGQYVQRMLKLQTVVEMYPRCWNGVEAKRGLADEAERLLDDGQEMQRQGMENIARDRAVQAHELIQLVRENLLVRLLSTQERDWMQGVELSSELPPSLWLQQESELARRLQTLSERLPSDLREAGP